ncbi:MAG: class I SAM-dependent methyltransferase, partial [Thermoanaerobaculia bacterium]
MAEYQYSSDAPMWESGFLWRRALRILRRDAPPPRAVFELGCGNGATARLLAAEGYSVTGVDSSPTGIEMARRHQSERLRFEIGSTSDDLAGKYGQFPIVLSLEVIEHCPSAREYMQTFLSLLAPGGIGILSTP